MGKSKGRKKKHRQRSGPPFLSEFCNKASDLLRKEYGTELMVCSVSTLTPSGVAIHSNAMYKRQPPVDSRVKPRNASFIAHSDSMSELTANLSLSKQIAPSTALTASLGLPDFSTKMSAKFRLRRQLSQSLTAKASLKLPDYNSCNISLCSLRPNTALSMGIGGNGVTFQASHGTKSLAVGIQTSHKTASSCLRIGILGTHLRGTASIIYSTKGNKIRATIHRFLDKEKKISAALDIGRSLSACKSTLTAAGSWAVDDRTAVKARLDHRGTMKALVRHSMKEYNSVVSVSGEFNLKNLTNIPKIGLAILVMP